VRTTGWDKRGTARLRLSTADSQVKLFQFTGAAGLIQGPWEHAEQKTQRNTRKQVGKVSVLEMQTM